MKLPTSPINSARMFRRRSQGTVFSCESFDSRGAAASRLLFRFRLDPLPGFPASNLRFCWMRLGWFLRRNQ